MPLASQLLDRESAILTQPGAMDQHPNHQRAKLPFYHRMAARTYENVNLQFPSNEDVRDSGIYSISAFQNDFSPPEKVHRISLIRPNVDDNHLEHDEVQVVATKDRVQSILAPTVIICMPIALLAAALLALVLIFRVDPQPGIFALSADPSGGNYILVDFSASKSADPNAT